MSYSWKDGLPWHSAAHRAYLEHQVAAQAARAEASADALKEIYRTTRMTPQDVISAQKGVAYRALCADKEALSQWRPKEVLPHPSEAGRFWAAINLSPSGDPEWQIDLIWLDDETHDIHADCGAHYSWNDYELWQPAVVPPAPIEEDEDD